MEELRQFERFVLNAPAKLYFNKNERNSRIIPSVAQDISSGGAFISMNNMNLSKNTELIVEVILTIDALKKLYGYSNEVKLTSKASIIRTTNNGIGVCFKGKPVMLSNSF